MGTKRKFDLDHRLEAYFATLRSSSLKRVLKRSMGNWQIYAAVSGSAVAMATGASAAIISSIGTRVMREPTASARLAPRNLTSSNNVPFLNDVKLALTRQNVGQRLFNVARARMDPAIPAQAPSIAAGGVVPAFGETNVIQPGEWVSIYGLNLASQTAVWNNDFPTLLAGTSVTINGKPAYLAFVSPTQINLQAPDDTAVGQASVVVTTPNGTTTSTVTLSQFAPSFSLLYKRFVTGIILRSDGAGASGGGAYDILGPTGNSFGPRTVAAQAGDSVELFGFGFGPMNPAVPAGQAFSGSAPINNDIHLYINDVAVQPSFVGLTSAGVYQINLLVPPGLGEGAVPIRVQIGGLQTQMHVLFSLEGVPGATGTGGGVGVGGSSGGGTSNGLGGGTSGMGGGTAGGGGGGTAGGMGGGTGGGGGADGGSGGGSDGGSGGGSAALRKKPYLPKLRFEPDPEVREG